MTHCTFSYAPSWADLLRSAHRVLLYQNKPWKWISFQNRLKKKPKFEHIYCTFIACMQCLKIQSVQFEFIVKKKNKTPSCDITKPTSFKKFRSFYLLLSCAYVTIIVLIYWATVVLLYATYLPQKCNHCY